MSYNKYDFKIEVGNELELDSSIYVNDKIKNKLSPLVILLHGWNNNKSELEYFIHSLLDKNYKVLSYSYRGHGNSNGERNLVDIFSDINKVIDYIVNLTPYISDINLVGISLGAAIALTQGYKNSKVSHIFALNPYFNLKQTLEECNNPILQIYFKILAKKYNIEQVNNLLSPKYFIDPNNISNKNRLYFVITMNDSFVNINQKIELLNFTKSPISNVKVFQDSNHTFDDIKDSVVKTVVNWLSAIYPG